MYSENKEKIIRDIFSKDKTIRRSAIKKIKDFQDIDNTIVNYLILMLEDKDSGVVDAAYNVLIEIDNELVIKKLTNILTTKNTRLKNYAFEILNQKGKIVAKNLIEKLNNDDVEIKKFALDVLGEIGDTEYENYIMPLLNDPDPNVRYAAAEALGKIGSIKSANALINKLNTEKELWVKYVIIDSLSKIGDNKIAKKLIKSHLHDNTYIFESIITAVSKIGDKTIIQQLFNILPSVGEYEKFKIVNSIYNLIKKYGDSILMRIKIDNSIVEILKNLLNHKIANKYYTIILLSYFVKPDDYFLFLPFLESENEEEKNAAIVALKKLKSPEVIPYLLQIFDYSGIYTKLNIIDCLAEFNNKLIYNKFINSIDNEPESIKISICKLLTNYYNYAVKQLFKNLLNTYKENIVFYNNLKRIISETDKTFFNRRNK